MVLEALMQAIPVITGAPVVVVVSSDEVEREVFIGLNRGAGLLNPRNSHGVRWGEEIGSCPPTR